MTALGQLLNAFSHRSVLERGFALVRGEDGQPVRSAAAVNAGAVLDIEVRDGHISAVVPGTSPGAPKKTAASPAKPSKQGSLF